MPQLPLWLAASLLLVPAVLYLGFRTYRAAFARLEHERRQAQQMSALHLATIEALALAIDAKDQAAHNHIRRVQIYATALARALGALFIRSYERGERVHLAMLSRGYTGRLPT